MSVLLIQPEKVPSAFAVEEAPLHRNPMDAVSSVPLRSWTARLAVFGRQALDSHRQMRNARGVAAW